MAGNFATEGDYAPLTMDRYITGLVTMRSALRDADVPYLQAKFYSAGRFDSIIDGLNVEISAKSTLIRRPGSSVYNSQSFPPISRFYPFRTEVDGQDVVHVMADTAGAVYDATGPNRKLNIWSKAAGAGKTCFQSVGNTLYFSNLLENKKWMLSTTVWGPTKTFQPGQWIVDENNNIQLIPQQKVSSVASIEIASGVVTVRLQGPDQFSTGTNVTLAGLTTAAFLNGQVLQPTSALVANGFQAVFSHADYADAADTGTATSGLGASITGATEPTWGTTVGAITNDGTVQWVCWGSAVQNWGIAAPAVAPSVVQTSLPATYPAWTASTIYSTSLSILDSNGNVQRLVTGGVTGTSQPTWSATPGGVTVDGTAGWRCQGPAVWVASAAHTLGDIVSVSFTYYVSVPNPDSGDWAEHEYGYSPYYQQTYTQVPVTETDLFLCTTAGVSGGSAPAWGSGQGLIVQDGSVVWTNIGSSHTWAASVGPSTNVSLATKIVDSNGNFQTITTSGKSGTTAPTWSTTQGAATADGTVVWNEAGSYSAASSYQQIWGFAYKNSIDNTISTVSPISIPVITGANKIATLQGACSTDPQVDTIVIYRTLQNGTILFEDDQIPQPAGTTWTYNDTNPDAALTIQLQAARAQSNNPPPIGIQALTFHLGRIFAAVKNFVYWCTGPDATVGNGLTAWDPDKVSAYPDSVKRLVPVSITNGGVFAFTVSDLYAIYGDGTASNPFQPKIYGAGIGLLNHDALDVVGATIHLFTTARKMVTLDPSAGYTEPGAIIGDQFKKVTTGGISAKLYDPSSAFVTWHESESADTALFIADGSVGWFRYSPISVPETGFLWSPRAAIQGGISAVQSVETQPGIKSLLIGPKTNGPILMRDLAVNSDNAVPYSNTYATIGSIQLCQPYEECEVAGVVLDSIRVGTAPTIGILWGEIAPTAAVPFDLYTQTGVDPPNLPASATTFNDRFSTMQNDRPTLCRHLQLLIQWSSEDAASELLTHTIYGAKHAERKVA